MVVKIPPPQSKKKNLMHFDPAARIFVLSNWAKDTTLWQFFFGTLYLFDSIFSGKVWLIGCMIFSGKVWLICCMIFSGRVWLICCMIFSGKVWLIGCMILMKKFVSLITAAIEVGKRHFFNNQWKMLPEEKCLIKNLNLTDASHH